MPIRSRLERRSSCAALAGLAAAADTRPDHVHRRSIASTSTSRSARCCRTGASAATGPTPRSGRRSCASTRAKARFKDDRRRMGDRQAGRSRQERAHPAHPHRLRRRRDAAARVAPDAVGGREGAAEALGREGADYKPHWSLIPVHAVDVPRAPRRERAPQSHRCVRARAADASGPAPARRRRRRHPRLSFAASRST